MSLPLTDLCILDRGSPNHDERPCPVDMLILHYTGMKTQRAAVDRLRDPQSRVSSHYVVCEDGGVLRLVPEERRAWHAGVSYWRGQRMLNDCSIGIEIVNPGHEWGYRSFPQKQMSAVCALCLDLSGRHAIPPERVLGHSDIAPTRKQDPGELFDWHGLAASGIGLWPAQDGAAASDLSATLTSIGYEFGDLSDLIAFQRHWLPDGMSGEADLRTRTRAFAVLQTIISRGLPV